jgi:branched-chain amino acid transport system permease protein
MAKMTRKGWFIIGGFCLILFFAPFFLRGYWVRLLTNMFMFGILAESVNIIAGYCGYLALGNMFFFGLGAYIVAVLMTKFAFSFLSALIIAGLGASFFSMLVGLPILRLKGQYFLMGTVGLLELLREITSNISLTGGGQGITLPIFPGGAAAANNFFYYFMFAVMVISIACTFYISKSHLGYAFRAIKFDEDTASVMGINPTPYKTLAWSISAFFTSLAGGGYAYWMSYIDPGEVYQIMPSVKMYLMMVLGGSGTVLGPIAGAFFIEFISELVWGKFLEMHFLILGLILVFVVIFTPKGFMELLQRGFTLSKLISGVKESRIS